MRFLAEIIEQNGFTVEEIRIARYLNPSAHQTKTQQKLRESVIVFNNS